LGSNPFPTPVKNVKPRFGLESKLNLSDLMLSMGCDDQEIYANPFFEETIDWKLELPKWKPIEKVREIRNDIEQRVRNLVAST